MSVAMLCATSLLSSCSKEENGFSEELQEKTYSGLTDLTVTYNGTKMAGKSVDVKPVGTSGALLTAYSRFNLSQLSDDFKNLPPLTAPGVLPGSTELNLNVSLYPADGGYSFSGKGENDFVTYNYSGLLSVEKLALDLTDVLLKDQTLAGGVWAPAPVKEGEEGPFHTVWETEMPVEIPGLENGLGDILQLVLNVPLIPAYNNTSYMSLAQVITGSLRTLAFNSDANLVITYLKTADGSSIYTPAPLCMVQYAPLATNMMKLWINPTDVLSVALTNLQVSSPDIPENPFGKKTRSDYVSLLMPIVQKAVINALPQMAVLLAQGIPADYEITGDKMSIYLGTNVMQPIIKKVITDMLADGNMQALMVQIVAELVKADPTIVQYLPKLQQLFNSIPQIIEQSTKIELGINLVKAA